MLPNTQPRALKYHTSHTQDRVRNTAHGEKTHHHQQTRGKAFLLWIPSSWNKPPPPPFPIQIRTTTNTLKSNKEKELLIP